MIFVSKLKNFNPNLYSKWHIDEGGRKREEISLLVVFCHNSYYSQMRHWLEPEWQAHRVQPCPTLCPRDPSNLSKLSRWGVGSFVFQTASDMILCDVSARTFTLHITLLVPVSVWSGCTATPRPAEQLWVFKQSVPDDLQSCDETSGGKCKVNSRYTGVWFTSLNCFPPSRALPPLWEMRFQVYMLESGKTNEF